ncbi:kinase-like protein [Agrocybe pediades]|nr:kinase-like protein [Agrocybe pediades]
MEDIEEKYVRWGKIRDCEEYWIGMQPFLLRKGYKLRPRYDPTWQPPWLHEDKSKRISPLQSEESRGLMFGVALDAVRVKDGQKVVLKKIPTNTDELKLVTLLSSAPMKEDRRNCSVPILDVLLSPVDDEYALIVMPFLASFDLLPFRFLGEFCEFSLQVLEGLAFLHEHGIAHRDLGSGNIMMDSTKMVPKGIHFAAPTTHDGVSLQFEWNTRWSVRPVQYYIIDFGESQQYKSKEGARMLGVWGQDRTAPELSDVVPYNPFNLDIYVLGNVFRQVLVRYDGLDEFHGLAVSMMNKCPELRPTAEDAVRVCKRIVEEVQKKKRMTARVWQTHFTDGFPIRRGAFKKFAIQHGWANPPF